MIERIVQAEKDNRKFDELPMTQLLFKFLKSVNGFEEKTKLTYNDWRRFLGLLLNFSSKPPLSNI